MTTENMKTSLGEAILDAVRTIGWREMLKADLDFNSLKSWNQFEYAVRKYVDQYKFNNDFEDDTEEAFKEIEKAHFKLRPVSQCETGFELLRHLKNGQISTGNKWSTVRTKIGGANFSGDDSIPRDRWEEEEGGIWIRVQITYTNHGKHSVWRYVKI